MHRGPAAAPVLLFPSGKNQIKFLQLNVDRKAVTQDILLRKAHRDGVHLVIINEPNKKIVKNRDWLVDEISMRR